MSDKPDKPTTVPPMKTIPPDAQLELIQRHHIRKNIIEAVKQLQKTIKGWVTDIDMDEDQFQSFAAAGHRGEYETEYPKDTLVRKLTDLGWDEEELANIPKQLMSFDLMTVEELQIAYSRITKMIQLLEKYPQGGPFKIACNLYRSVGKLVRDEYFERTKQYPEQLPTPDVKITGRESAKQLKPQNYQPPLLPSGDTQ